MAPNNQREEVLTPQDVFDVRGYLLEYLPAELANQILDTLSTGPNLFKIESHDQGWGGEDSQGSWTWFEAAIVRDFKDEYSEGSDDEAKIRQALSIRERRSKRGPIGHWDIEIPPTQWFFGWFGSTTPTKGPTLITVKNPNMESDVWDIQRNARASREYRLHEVVWTRDLNEEVDEEAHFQATGSKLGVGFVRSLQAGDRIAVLARAQYPAWVNWVKSVDLEIYLSV
ncbi:hypothetical protein BDZ97DRAFT_1815262 [Flammula alnicola]|nr:hypothetical protein BDZ97DRAFT_1815262 [Flammula alnicola]